MPSTAALTEGVLSGGWRTTTIHTLTDRFCHMFSFLVTGGQVANCKVGALLLERLPACRIVMADKGYNSDAIPRQIEATGAAPIIPPKVNRRWKPCFSPCTIHGCNAIKRMFGCLKDFRRIATQYDPLAANCLAATVSCWL